MKSVFARARARHTQVKNRVTAAAYAAAVCGLRIWAVKNSTVRFAAPGDGAGSVACAHRPITPFMPRAPPPPASLAS